jgi:hypothetical protein
VELVPVLDLDLDLVRAPRLALLALGSMSELILAVAETEAEVEAEAGTARPAVRGHEVRWVTTRIGAPSGLTSTQSSST